MTNNQKDHLTFLKHLKESEEARWTIARWIWDKGYDVKIPVTKSSEKYEERMDYVDSGDIYFKDGNTWQRAEAKQLSRTFTSLDDWPFHRFIVCQKHAWDMAKPKPEVFLYLNRPGTHMAYLWTGPTQLMWRVETIKDTRYIDYVRDYYVCDPHWALFIPIGGE